MAKKTAGKNVGFDVSKLPIADAATAAAIKSAAGIGDIVAGAQLDAAQAATKKAAKATKPGTERWPVKTGADPDAGKVQQTVVQATVEELALAPRPKTMPDPKKIYKAFQNKRAAPTETTIWQVTAQVISIKLEVDGDYHLVLQGDSGRQIIGEIPTPGAPFVKASSPFGTNIKQARQAFEKQFFPTLKSTQFMAMAEVHVPVGSFSNVPKGVKPLKFGKSVSPAAPGGAVTFQTKVKPTSVTITGVGFFDEIHGQNGVAPNGFELHPVLKVEFS